jgi:hypothetical protein
VTNLWRYAQVSAQANARYLEALAQAQSNGKAIAELDGLCQPRRVDGKRYATACLPSAMTGNVEPVPPSTIG